MCQVCPGIKHPLQSLEESICSRFIPAITGRDPPNNLIRDLLALPTRFGGMGRVNPTTLASVEYNASLRVAEPLKNAILEQDGLYSFQCWEAQMDVKKQYTTKTGKGPTTPVSIFKHIIMVSLSQILCEKKNKQKHKLSLNYHYNSHQYYNHHP